MVKAFRILFAFTLTLALVANAHAQSRTETGGTYSRNPMTVAQMLALSSVGRAKRIVVVTDGATASDCATGGGSNIVFCFPDGAGAFEALPATGGGGGAVTSVTGGVEITCTPTTGAVICDADATLSTDAELAAHAGNAAAHHTATVDTGPVADCVTATHVQLQDGSCVDPATQAELDAHTAVANAHHAPTIDTGPVADCVTATHVQLQDGTCADPALQTELDAHTGNASAHHVKTVDTDTTCLDAGVACNFAGSASEGGSATSAAAVGTDAVGQIADVAAIIKDGIAAKLATTDGLIVGECVQRGASGLVSTGAACGSGTGGEVNTGANLGTGAGLFAQKTGTVLEFKSLVAGANITLTPTSTEVTIASSGGGTVSSVTGSGDLTCTPTTGAVICSGDAALTRDSELTAHTGNASAHHTATVDTGPGPDCVNAADVQLGDSTCANPALQSELDSHAANSSAHHVKTVDTDTTCLDAGVTCNFAAAATEGGAATDLACTDCVAGTDLAPLSVGTAELAAAAVDNAKLANLAVTDAKIAAGTITPAKIASVAGVTGANEDDVTLADVQAATTSDFHNIGGVDDTTPKAGEFGNATDLDANGALVVDSVDYTEIDETNLAIQTSGDCAVLDCASVGEICWNTTSNTCSVCEVAGTPGTWAGCEASTALNLANMFWVTTAGSDDAACGPISSPCASPQQAIANIDTNGAQKALVRLAPGQYTVTTPIFFARQCSAGTNDGTKCQGRCSVSGLRCYHDANCPASETCDAAVDVCTGGGTCLSRGNISISGFGSKTNIFCSGFANTDYCVDVSDTTVWSLTDLTINSLLVKKGVLGSNGNTVIGGMLRVTLATTGSSEVFDQMNLIHMEGGNNLTNTFWDSALFSFGGSGNDAAMVYFEPSKGNEIGVAAVGWDGSPACGNGVCSENGVACSSIADCAANQACDTVGGFCHSYCDEALDCSGTCDTKECLSGDFVVGANRIQSTGWGFAFPNRKGMSAWADGSDYGSAFNIRIIGGKLTLISDDTGDSACVDPTTPAPPEADATDFMPEINSTCTTNSDCVNAPFTQCDPSTDDTHYAVRAWCRGENATCDTAVQIIGTRFEPWDATNGGNPPLEPEVSLSAEDGASIQLMDSLYNLNTQNIEAADSSDIATFADLGVLHSSIAFDPRAADPTTPIEGMCWWDDAANRAECFDGTANRALAFGPVDLNNVFTPEVSGVLQPLNGGLGGDPAAPPSQDCVLVFENGVPTCPSFGASPNNKLLTRTTSAGGPVLTAQFGQNDIAGRAGSSDLGPIPIGNDEVVLHPSGGSLSGGKLTEAFVAAADKTGSGKFVLDNGGALTGSVLTDVTASADPTTALGIATKQYHDNNNNTLAQATMTLGLVSKNKTVDTTNRFWSPHGIETSTFLGEVDAPMPFVCTAKNLYVKTFTNLGTNMDVTITLMRNGFPTSLSCTIPGGGSTCNDTVNTESFNVSVRAAWRVVCTGSACGSTVSQDFNGSALCVGAVP